MNSWLALLDAPAGDLWASAGDRVLAGWVDATRRPHPLARRVDPQLLDPDGAPAHLSLLWLDREALPLFDDPAVVHARRAARRLPAPRAVSTLTVDSTHFAGSLWVTDDPVRLPDDPFRPLGHPVQLAVAGACWAGPARSSGPPRSGTPAPPGPPASSPPRRARPAGNHDELERADRGQAVADRIGGRTRPGPAEAGPFRARSCRLSPAPDARQFVALEHAGHRPRVVTSGPAPASLNGLGGQPTASEARP